MSSAHPNVRTAPGLVGTGGRRLRCGPGSIRPAPGPVGSSAPTGGAAGVAVAHRRGWVCARSGERGLVVPVIAVRVQAELQHAEGLVPGGDNVGVAEGLVPGGDNVAVAVVAVLGGEGVECLAGADGDLRAKDSHPPLATELPAAPDPGTADNHGGRSRTRRAIRSAEVAGPAEVAEYNLDGNTAL